MNVKKVFLHLGISKTGSSSIQKTLFTNSTVLERNGFRYLNEWGVDHDHKLAQKIKPCSKANPIFNIARKRYTEYFIKKMLKVINTTKSETIIFSGEYWLDFYLDSAIDNLNNFIERYFKSRGIETKIIVFVRNPLTWMISHLQQRIGTGNYRRNQDLVEIRIKSFPGIWNLKNNFGDSLILVKFEDAVDDEYGLVGFFLRIIGFPKGQISEINMVKTNESRCMETMEFINYIEDKEPAYSSGKTRFVNINRKTYGLDLTATWGIRGLKFDLAYHDKIALKERLKETVFFLKEHTGIDYTDYQIPSVPHQEIYSNVTIQDFIDAFPKLSPLLQKLFLSFFENKYSETLNPKFKSLYFKDSIPRYIYNKHNPVSWCIWYIRNISHMIKATIKTIAKNILVR